MSATNRGEERYEYDAYNTPLWVTHRFLDKFGSQLPDGNWLEPCVGGGAILEAVAAHRAMTNRLIKWTTCEIQAALEVARPKSYGDRHTLVKNLTMDFRAPLARHDLLGTMPMFDVCITNPPFGIAQEVAMQAMTMARNVILLLRLNFYGSKERHGWISQHVPHMTATIPDRPAFRLSKKTGKVGTDATEYAWFWWQLPFKRDHGYITVLDRTAEVVLKEDKNRIRYEAGRELVKAVDAKVAAIAAEVEAVGEDHPMYQEYLDDVRTKLVE